MREEDKYYVPDILEFHPGFEFEMYDNDFSGYADWSEEVFCGLMLKKTMGQRTTDLKKIKEYIGKDFIRAKYLDREDIESEGWELIKDYSDEYIFQKFITDEQWHELNFDKYEKKISIELWQDSEEGSSCKTLFYGIVKNKSEFKRILKQIGII